MSWYPSGGSLGTQKSWGKKNGSNPDPPEKARMGSNPVFFTHDNSQWNNRRVSEPYGEERRTVGGGV